MSPSAQVYFLAVLYNVAVEFDHVHFSSSPWRQLIYEYSILKLYNLRLNIKIVVTYNVL